MDTGLGYLKTGSKFETKVKVAGPIGIGTTAVGVMLNFEEGFTKDAVISSVILLFNILLQNPGMINGWRFSCINKSYIMCFQKCFNFFNLFICIV